MNNSCRTKHYFKRMFGNILSISMIVAMSIPVTGSVYALVTAPPEGFHDGMDGITNAAGCTAFGWAVDPDNRDRDLQVQILADGNPVATTIANLLREDVGVCTGGTCGFEINLWGLISAGQAHQITARAYDEETSTWINLLATPKTLTCWGYPDGFHDGNQGLVGPENCNASGWAVDPDNSDRDLQIQILADGNPVAITTANLLREDVTACPGGTCGYHVDLWGLISQEAEHQITSRAYDQETSAWMNLEATPKLLTCQLSTFEDVSSTHWAWNFIERLYKAGITGGCATNPLRYCPEATVTRAQMAVFLEKGLHYPNAFTPANASPTFTDTVAHWAEDWIEALRSDGITGGCGPNLYCPEDPVTRAQMAVFLLKAKYGSSYTPPAVGAGTGFIDVPVTHWAAPWIKQLAAEGITGGCGTGIYCPEDSVTRAQMAVFLVKTFNLP